MPSTAAEWKIYSVANEAALVAIIRSIKGYVLYKNLAAEAGISVFIFSRTIREDEERRIFKISEYEKIVNYLINEEGNYLQITKENEINNYISSAHNLFDYRSNELKDAARRFSGIYESYRCSFRLREFGGILRGLTEIRQDADGDLIRVKEMYRIQKEIGISNASDTYFERNGFFLPQSGDAPPKILSKKADGTSDFQVIYLTRHSSIGTGKSSQVQNELWGFLVDWEQTVPYATGLYFNRLDDQEISLFDDNFDRNLLKAFKPDNPEILVYVEKVKRKFKVLHEGILEI